MEFNIPAMSCGHCVRAITEAVKQADSAAQVTVDLATKHVTVQTSHTRDAVALALKEAGYTPQ